VVIGQSVAKVKLVDMWKLEKSGKFKIGSEVVFEPIKILSEKINLICRPEINQIHVFKIELIVRRLNGSEFQGLNTCYHLKLT
jgi:hypothetical protein